MSARQSSGGRIALVVIVGVLPALIVGIGVAQYVLNHFYARAPVLLDAGWFSAIVYRSGVTQRNPAIACDYAVTYWGLHVAPLLTAFSLLSYIVPVARIEWYAFFQALVQASLALPVPFLASRLDPAPRRRSWPILAAGSLAFALSGQALLCIAYPHYECLIPAFIALLLVATVTDLPRTSWVLLALACSVREDAGLHAGLALLPIAYLKWRDHGAVTPSLRRILGLVASAFAASVVAIALQKLLFHPADLLRAEYLGIPLFAHLGGAVIAERIRHLATWCVFISVPLLGSVVVAVVRGDARYLLGWAAATPWLVLNLLAVQEAKWHFFAYTGFPFLVSVFWVALYGAALAPARRRLSSAGAALVLLAICGSGAIAVARTYPDFAAEMASGMLTAEPGNRSGVRAFARAIHDRHDALGRLYVDDAVAALAVESVALAEAYAPGVTGGDTFAFHAARVDRQVLADLAAAGIQRCTHVVRTGLYLCARSPAAALTLGSVATETLPPLFAFSDLDATSRRIELLPRGVVVHEGSAPGIIVASHEIQLAGRFELVWDLEVADAAAAPAELVTAEVFTDHVARGTAKAAGVAGAQRLVLPFTARADQPTQWRLTYAGGATVTIVGAQLRRASLDR